MYSVTRGSYRGGGWGRSRPGLGTRHIAILDLEAALVLYLKKAARFIVGHHEVPRMSHDVERDCLDTCSTLSALCHLNMT